MSSRSLSPLPLSKVIALALATLPALDTDSPDVSFEGQVVRVDADTTSSFAQSYPFILHSDAIRTYYKLQQSNTVYDPVILWLKAEVDTVTTKNKKNAKKKKSAPLRSNNKKGKGESRSDAVAVGSDEPDKDNDNCESSDTGSAVSWSDSDRESTMDVDNSGNEDAVVMEQIERECPLVAVLLSRRSILESLSGEILGIQPGDWIQVHEVVLLVEPDASGGNQKHVVIACVGRPKTVCHLAIRVDSPPPSPNKIGASPRPRTVAPLPRKRKSTPPRVKSVTPPLLDKSNTPLRTRTTPSLLPVRDSPPTTDSYRAVIPQAVSTSTSPSVRSKPPTIPKFTALTSNAETRQRLSLPHQAPRAQHSSLNPLEFFVSSLDAPHAPQRMEPEHEIVSLSQVWRLETEPMASVETGPGADDETMEDRVESTPIRRHVCTLSSINTCRIRAICAECDNDYRNMACTFGCFSKKWRLDIQMDCSIRDGTAEATLRVGKDQEAILWTLLGLQKYSHRVDDGNASEINPRSEECVKILSILSRRGVLSFKKIEAPAASSSSLSSSSSSSRSGASASASTSSAMNLVEGFVETVNNDSSQRAKEEEKLWLKVCLGQLARQTSIRQGRFVLDATVGPPVTSLPSSASSPSSLSGAVASSSSSPSSTAPFVEKSVLVGRQQFLTLVIRRPLILNAVNIQWITPVKEARMLLDLLKTRDQVTAIV